MDSGVSLRVGGYHQKSPQAGAKSLHNFADFERHRFRKNPVNSIAYKHGLQTRTT
jgi:hypothetical protein